jgi:hypothetical protein
MARAARSTFRELTVYFPLGLLLTAISIRNDTSIGEWVLRLLFYWITMMTIKGQSFFPGLVSDWDSGLKTKPGQQDHLATIPVNIHDSTFSE